MRKKRISRINTKCYKLPIETLMKATNCKSVEDFYNFVFSGNSSCVRPVWFTVAQQSEEEYWVLNQPYMKFITRTVTVTLPDTLTQEDPDTYTTE